MIELIQNIVNEILLNNIDMTDAAESTEINISSISCYAIQCSWTNFTGDTTERIITSGSNDGVIWTAVDTFVPSGSTGNRLLNVEKAGYRFVKLSYTQGITTGTLFATISGKVI